MTSTPFLCQELLSLFKTDVNAAPAQTSTRCEPCGPDGNIELCFGCEGPPTEDEPLVEKYHKKLFHRRCKRGLERKHRALRKVSTAAVTRDVNEMTQRTVEWRSASADFFVGDDAPQNARSEVAPVAAREAMMFERRERITSKKTETQMLTFELKYFIPTL